MATMSFGDNDLIEDLTPQLGGDLDVNDKDIISESNGNIVLDTDGTGNVLLNPDSYGYVGIGTTAPDYRLHVTETTGTCSIGLDSGDADKDKWAITTSDIGGQAVLEFSDVDNIGNVLTLNGDTGYVGINDSTPQYRLDVNGTFRAVGAATLNNSLSLSTTAVDAVINLQSDSNSLFSLNADTDGKLYLGSSNPVTILNTGVVGINDTTPTHTLDVGGTLRITGAATFDDDITLDDGKKVITDEIKALDSSGLRLTGSSDASTLGILVNNNGDVAIGTASFSDEKFNFSGAMALFPRTTPTYNSSWGKLYVDSADDYLHFIDKNNVNHNITTKDYAEIFTYNGTTAQTSIGTSYVKMTTFSVDGQNGLYQGATASYANNWVVASDTGVYKASISCSFSGTNGTTFDVGLFINNGVTQKSNVHFSRKLSSVDIGAASCQGLVSLTRFDTVEIWIKADGTGKSFTGHDVTLNIEKVGE